MVSISPSVKELLPWNYEERGEGGNSHTYDMEKLYARLLMMSQHRYINVSDLWERSADKLKCIKWIHKRYSGLRGDLSLLADGFRCKQCDGTIQEADLAQGLVDGWRDIWVCKGLSLSG